MHACVRPIMYLKKMDDGAPLAETIHFIVSDLAVFGFQGLCRSAPGWTLFI